MNNRKSRLDNCPKQRKRKFYEIEFGYRNGGARGFYVEDTGAFHVDLGHLSDLVEPPCITFDKSRGRLPRDFERWYGFWLISDRAKVVFESLDPEAFTFVPCDVRVPKGVWEGPRYWFCDVLRVLDALDEDRSRLRIGIRNDSNYRDFGQKFYEFFGGAELIFREELVGDAHVFRMAYYKQCIICDQEMKNACKAAGLRGFLFEEASNLSY